jgi:serine protease Do
MRAALPTAAGPLFCAALALPALAQDGTPDAAGSVEQRTREIKETAAPAVVAVTVTPRTCPLPRLVLPGLAIGPNATQPEKVEGTGFLVAAGGLLVTTRDLVDGAERIEVRFCDGTVRDASLVGADAPFRVAVLRTSAPDGTTALSRAPRVEAGESTIGWFLGATAGTGTAAPSVDVQVACVHPAPEEGAGYDRYLYAPISIARGTAGGPLVGSDNRLLGMAVGSLVARDDAAATNVGVRLPRATLFVRGDDVAEAARQISATGAVQRPMLGVVMDGETTRIDTLFAGSPAEAAGLAEGDTIVGFGAVRISSVADLSRAMLRRCAGEPVKVTVERAAERVVKCVTLAPFREPPPPTRPPFAGAVIEVSIDAKGDRVCRFIQVNDGSPVAKAGVLAGDRLVAVDDRCAWRFVQRHCARPSPVPPAKITIERDGHEREIALPSE